MKRNFRRGLYYLNYTLKSVTGGGHVKYQENALAGKLHGSSAWKIIAFYLLYLELYIWMSSGHVLIMCKLPCIINNDHIFLSFGMCLPGQSSFHLYMACQLLQNMTSGHIKIKKGTGHVCGHCQSRYWECNYKLKKLVLTETVFLAIVSPVPHLKVIWVLQFAD